MFNIKFFKNSNCVAFIINLLIFLKSSFGFTLKNIASEHRYYPCLITTNEVLLENSIPKRTEKQKLSDQNSATDFSLNKRKRKDPDIRNISFIFFAFWILIKIAKILHYARIAKKYLKNEKVCSRFKRLSITFRIALDISWLLSARKKWGSNSKKYKKELSYFHDNLETSKYHEYFKLKDLLIKFNIE